jgi:C4-dicarboxylate-binding protein DctP
MKRILVLLAVCVAVLSAGDVRAQDEPILIRFSHVVSEDSPKGFGAQRFKELAEARLLGRVRVEIYPRSIRFTDEEVMPALLFGDVEMAAPSLVQLRAYAPQLQVFELPFLFKDVDHVHRFQDSIVGRQMLELMLPRDIVGLAYWDNGMRVISANTPIRAPEDAEGLLFRTEPSQVFLQAYNRIAATTLPIPFAMLTDAIRDGLVDGQENTWSNIYTRGVHRFHQHFTTLDHSFLGYMVIANDTFWQGLPDEVRTTLEAIIEEITPEVNALARERSVSDRERVVAETDAEIIEPSAEAMERWREAFTPVWGAFDEQIGQPVIDAALAAERAPRQP